MITVTNDYKTATQQPSKQWSAYLVDSDSVYPDEITDEDDLKSLKITAESNILRTVMRQAEAVYFDPHSYLDLYVNLGIGLTLANDSVEEIDYGSFLVVEAITDVDTNETTLKMFDKMYESLIEYDLDPIYDVGFPATISELLQAICTRLGWTLKTGSDVFPNSTYSLTTDPITNLGYTFRDVLEDIAEVAGSIIYFDVDDELVVKQVSHDSPLETLDTSYFKTLSLQSKFGVVNSVVLSRSPQEDNIVDKNQSSIDANGLTEVKIKNNELVDDDRETAVTPILNELDGLEYYPFEAETDGLGYLQIGDRITVQDLTPTSYETIITFVEIDVTGGVVETLKSVAMDKTTSNYLTAGIIGQRIRDTEIVVDKQTGLITLINQDINSIEGSLTIIEQSIEDVQIDVQSIGGTNLLKNSAALKGSIEEWQELDSNGDPIDSRNDGTVVQTTDVANNTESGSGIKLDNQYIQQSFATISGESYTFYCRFKKTNDASVTIDGTEYDLSVTGYTDGEWAVFTQEFEATGSSAILTIENGASDSLIISDMVVKLGNVSGWIQAPNEVYGNNYRFDKDGFEITSTTNNFKAILDSEKLTIYDISSGSDVIVAQFANDYGIIKDLTVQDSLTVERADDSSNGLQMIPTANGILVVIND